MLQNSSFLKYLTYLFFITGVCTFLAARWHLLSFPLERDEGEYAYMGSLLLKGYAPYTLAYNMKWPGVYFTYGLFMQIMGENLFAIRFGTMVYLLITILLVFSLLKKQFNLLAASMGALTYAFLSCSWHLLGQAAHATHFVVFYSLLGIWLIQEAMQTADKGKSAILITVSGIALFLALLCKQSAVFYVGFAIYLLVQARPNRRRHLFFFIGTMGVMVAITMAYFIFWGNFTNLIFWTFTYLAKYGTQVPLSWVPALFVRSIQSILGWGNWKGSLEAFMPLFLLGFLGLIALIFITIRTKQKGDAAVFAFSSFLTVVPGFYFRDHYYLSALPAISLGIAFLIYKLPHISWLVLGGLGVCLFFNLDFLFLKDPTLSCKAIYTRNPFSESPIIAKFIQANSHVGDKLLVLGSEPQLYFESKRQSSTGFIYMYPMMENHSYALEMQQQMSREIELNPPQLIVFVKIYSSWLTRPESHTYLTGWANNFTSTYYHLIGAMSVLPDQLNTLSTFNDLRSFKPVSNDVIYIFERNKSLR